MGLSAVAIARVNSCIASEEGSYVEIRQVCNQFGKHERYSAVYTDTVSSFPSILGLILPSANHPHDSQNTRYIYISNDNFEGGEGGGGESRVEYAIPMAKLSFVVIVVSSG